jgi:translation initiation factor IF-1
LIVDGAGNAAKTGAVVSVTIIVCEVVEVLPQESVAVHTLTTVYDPAHVPGVVNF